MPAPAPRLPRLTLALLLGAVACGGDGGGDDDGSPFADAGAGGDGGAGAAGEPVAVFVFDDQLGAVLRLVDATGDGDLHDAGEARRWYDGDAPLGLTRGRALHALDARTLLALDDAGEVAPLGDRLLRLHDGDDDGDAGGDGEATALWDGALPGGGHLSRPIALAADDGALFVADSNADDLTAAFAIYRLADDDQDGAIAAAEAERYVEVAPPGGAGRAIGDLEVAGGALWMLGVDGDGDEALFRVDPDDRAIEVALDGAALLEARQLAMSDALGRLAALPSGELVFQVLGSPDGFAALVAVRDADADGAIDPATELRIVWDEARHASRPTNFVARDLAAAPDGSVLALIATQGTVRRFVDLDGDGDADDPGEDRVVYDTAQAAAAGGENTADLRALTVTAR